MSRAFWLSLLVGYLAGAFAAAIYLPRAILAPSLSNLILLTLFSALFVIVVSWRAWRGKNNNLPAWPWQSTSPVDNQNARIAEDDELLLEPQRVPPVDRRTHDHFQASRPQSEPAQHSIELSDEELGYRLAERIGRTASPEARLSITPAQTAGVASSPSDGFVCLCENLVTLPQRRRVGRRVSGVMYQDGRAHNRRSLMQRGLDPAALLEFDRATWANFADWLDRTDDPRQAGGQWLMELSVSALKSRKLRQSIDRLAETAEVMGASLLIALDVPARQSLPRLKAQTFGAHVSFHLRTSRIPPTDLLSCGFSGIVLDRADLEPFLAMPLGEDPICQRLIDLEEQGATVLFDNIASEIALRDVLDYPGQFAAGEVFGEPLIISEQDSRPKSAAMANAAGHSTFDRLRGANGYGLAGAGSARGY